MKLSKLLMGIHTESVFEDVEVEHISSDSRKIPSNCVFVCVKGNTFDSHNVVKELQSQGVKYFIVEHDVGVKNQIIVNNTRKAYSIMCDNYFDNPSKKLKIIGLTGTNGKTTTAFLLRNIIENAGHKCGLIGTVEYYVGEDKKFEGLTTPTSEQLFKYFSKMVDNNCEYCVMEVSSQALAQQRVFGVEFERGIFTNLTQDHLDYHGSMENYASAKRVLFKNCKTAIMNNDDEYADFLLKDTNCDVVSYSINNNADFKAQDIKLDTDSVHYNLNNKYLNDKVDLSIPGRFSIYNSLAAITCAISIGIPANDVLESVRKYSGVCGRAEIVDTNTPYTVMIDYAHSPDSLKNILKTLNEFKKGNIITVFGCGGDRDKTKRPQMGGIACELSDIAIVTSDNPRTEDPTSIIEDILVGTDSTNCRVEVIENRTQAIEFALKIAQKDDVILLAGKGHETYQILGTEKVHYDEREIVKNCLNN